MKKPVLRVLDTVYNRGKGLFLVSGSIHAGDVVVKMKDPVIIPRSKWNKKLNKDPDKERVKMFGVMLPDDIAVHGIVRHKKNKLEMVAYDQAMKNARLKYPRKRPDKVVKKGVTYTVYDQTLKSSGVPMWYRLNHSFKPNLTMLWRRKKDDSIEIVWVANYTMSAGTRSRGPQELTFNYGEVPSWWK